MVRLVKLKYSININLTTFDVTFNPNKHNWLEKKTKKKHSYLKKNITFKQNSPLTILQVFTVAFSQFFTIKIKIIFTKLGMGSEYEI